MPIPQGTAMSASVNSVINVFTNLFSNQGSTIFNAILIVATVGGQTIIRRLTFSCPCAFPLNVYHSLVFMFGPSIALAIIGIMINTTTWKIVHGCCLRHKLTRHTWKTVMVAWVEVLAQASVAPMAWLFVVFLDGGYFRCLSASHYCGLETSKWCQNSTILEYYKGSKNFDDMSGNGLYCPHCICNLDGSDASYLEAESQIMAWFLLIGYGLTALFALCCVRMADKYTLVQRNFVELYKGEEKGKFDVVAKEYASQLAESNARAFFDTHGYWEKRDWDWVSGIPEINNPMFARLKLIATEKTQQTYFTPLQLWTQNKGYSIPKPNIQPPECNLEEGLKQE